MDDVFDIDAVDSSSLDTDTSSNIEAVPTQNPYWQLPSDQLSHFLQLSSQFSWKSGRDLTSKSVSLSLSEDRTSVVCRATDFDTYLEFTIPQSSPNPITTTLIFPTATLIRVLKLCPTQFVLDSTPSVLILSQWVPVEAIILAPNLYINTDPIRNLGTLNLPNLSDLIPIAGSATVPKDRYLEFSGSTITSSYLWSTITRTLQTPSPIPFSLTSREAALVKALNAQCIELSVAEGDIERLVFSTPSSKLWIIKRDPAERDARQDDDPLIDIEYSSISKIVLLSTTIPTSSGLLQFTYKDSLIITYCSKLGAVQFPILSTRLNDNPPEIEDAVIQTKILALILKTLPQSTLSLGWDATSLTISGGDTSVTLAFEEN